MSDVTEVLPNVPVPWSEAMNAWHTGRFGDRDLIRRLAVEALESDIPDGCGISSSDINHTVYGAIAWGIRYNQTAEQVQDFLKARF